MTKTMRTVLDMLAKGAPCYVLPATRRALMRAGLIVYIDDPPRSGSTNGRRFAVTAKGLVALGATGEITVTATRSMGHVGLTPGAVYFTRPDGGVTTRKPRKYAKPIGIALDATTIELGVSQATSTKNKKRHRS